MDVPCDRGYKTTLFSLPDGANKTEVLAATEAGNYWLVKACNDIPDIINYTL